MRLLQLNGINEFSLVEYVGNNIPPYAILSHTWGKDHDEVTFNDLKNGGGKEKTGYRKLIFCAEQSTKDKVRYFWVDTCCIDKSSSAELSEAINSMFQWYRDAARCYVYLTDVSTGFVKNSVAFQDSRWFTRGWTLQELLAPKRVEFFSAEGHTLGDRCTLVQKIAEVTGISIEILIGQRALFDFSVDERMRWASRRQTTREEDKVYSLLGMFDVHMPLIYGEGYKKALRRLEKEIEADSKCKSRISAVSLGVEGAPTEMVSGVESAGLRVLLVSLEGQITHLSKQLTNQGHASHPRLTEVSDEADENEKRSELLESIERLQGVASQEGFVHDERAEPFIDDLERILSSVSVGSKDIPATSSKQKWKVSSGTEDISSREIKRLCGVVSSSCSVGLNVGAPRFDLTKKKLLLQKRKGRIVATQKYEVSIALNERRFSTLQDNQNQSAPEADTVETIVRVKISNHSEVPTVLVAYLHNLNSRSMSQSLHPVISIGKILPNNSPIFTIVQFGDVAQLKHLLTNHQCTLRDRDTWGTPLLHYAMRRPEMCKFLVENGADVDELAYTTNDRDFRGSPILADILDLETDIDELLPILECRRIILQAGADPTLPPDLKNTAYEGDAETNAFEHAAGEGVVDSLRVILDFGAPFLDIRTTDSYGHTALLNTACNFSTGYNAQRFGFLLDRGADIHARDFSGRTCLHIALSRAKFSAEPDQELPAITLLIQRGADIFAIDNAGCSIFNVAYECEHLNWGPVGGYRGDLWDAALSQCGYEKSIRRPEDRMRHYTEHYTRKHFERLWEGREHLCPYFSDSSRSCPFEDKTQRSGDAENLRYIEEIEDSEETEDSEDFSDSEVSQQWSDEEQEQLGSEIDGEIHHTDSERGQNDSEDMGGVLIGRRAYLDWHELLS